MRSHLSFAAWGHLAIVTAAAIACEPTGPPRLHVTSVDPPVGTTAVRRDASVRITFAAPMDRAATERAFRSDDLVEPTFAWDELAKTLTVTPREPLAYADAGDGSAPAKQYRYRIGSEAFAQDGRALVPAFEGHFTTLRQVSVHLPSEPALDGYVRQDGRVDTCDGDARFGVVCVGESSEAYLQYKGFLTFPLAPLPTDLTAIDQAYVVAWQYGLGNKPYEELGRVRLEHVVDVTALDQAAFDSGGDPVDREFSTSPELGWKRSANVVEAVAADHAARRPRSQFRLVFTVHRTSGPTYPLVARFYPGGVRDLALDDETRAKHPRLEIVYLIP